MQLYIKFKKIAAATMIILMVGACTNDFEEMNTKSYLITDAKIQPTVLFTNVLKKSIFGTYGEAGARVAEYSQYYASQASGDIFTNMDCSEPFVTWYTYVNNINEVIRLTATDPKKTDQHAMARIWKAWLFHIMTDVYGDIPYFEAGLGYDNAVLLPKYDTQEAIYTDMLKELKEAAAELGSQDNQLSFGNADILYHGNVENWKKFANSLRLRLAIRARFANATLASTNINDVINTPLIDENSENALLETLTPSETENVANINGMYYYYLTDETAIAFVGFGITDVMIPTNDPRLPVFCTPAKNGGANPYRGRPLQMLQDEKLPYGQDTVATVGPLLKAPTYKIIVMNAAEVYFLRAEAALANITSENEADMYLQGIQKSMEQYSIPEAGVTTFLSNPKVVFGGSEEEQFEQIVTQKYISTFYQGNQGYAEFRRTGYPKVWIGGQHGVTNGQIPRRLTYPTNEYLKNGENVDAAAARMGGDNFMTKVWWDKRAGVPFVHPKQGTFPPN